jgi:Calcineurin-like phosphoesterase
MNPTRNSLRTAALVSLLGLTIALGCGAPVSGEAQDNGAIGTTNEGIVAASAPLATLLVSADFASTSKTKSIVESEIKTNGSVKLLAVGDLSYSAPYATNYPWAEWAARTYPVMGNHEFNSVAGKGGKQAFDLFNGVNAADNYEFPAITGDNGVSTYDFVYSSPIAPGWLLVVANTGTDCDQQHCTAQATQIDSWIANWRTTNKGHGCVILAMHTARWSTMFSSDSDNLPWAPSVEPLWSAAITNKADIVLQGHVHVYEEFKKLGLDGTSSALGAKLFTVGAGGRGQVEPPQSNIAASELVASHKSPINGVLKLALYDGSYGYEFETAATSGEPASSVACNVP